MRLLSCSLHRCRIYTTKKGQSLDKEAVYVILGLKWKRRATWILSGWRRREINCMERYIK